VEIAKRRVCPSPRGQLLWRRICGDHTNSCSGPARWCSNNSTTLHGCINHRNGRNRRLHLLIRAWDRQPAIPFPGHASLHSSHHQTSPPTFTSPTEYRSSHRRDLTLIRLGRRWLCVVLGLYHHPGTGPHGVTNTSTAHTQTSMEMPTSAFQTDGQLTSTPAHLNNTLRRAMLAWCGKQNLHRFVLSTRRTLTTPGRSGTSIPHFW